MASQIAIDDRLFTWPSDDPHLLGSRCDACGTTTFPTQGSCPRCNSEDMTTVELPKRGTLWTYTTQGFRPKSAPEGQYRGDDTDETFVPYGIGYVEIPGHCKVEARLVGDVDGFAMDEDMELVIVPFCKDEHGNDLMTFAFKQVQDGAKRALAEGR